MHIPSHHPLPACVHVLGAAQQPGRALCAALSAAGIEVVALQDVEAAALANATHVVSCLHASQTSALIAATPAATALVLLGSTRRYTRWPDVHGNGVIAGETAFLQSGRHGVMLHATMFYGAAGENNVQRLAGLMRRLPILPLPAGGRAKLQPIHAQDVIACILAALGRRWNGPNLLVIAGPHPVSYAEFTRQIARAAGMAPRRIISLPAPLLMLGAAIARRLPGLPKVDSGEIRRLLEDKDFDIAPMLNTLGVQPRPLEAGLAETFAAGDQL